MALMSWMERPNLKNKVVAAALLVVLSTGLYASPNAKAAGPGQPQGPASIVDIENPDSAVPTDDDTEGNLSEELFPAFELDILKAEAILLDHLQRLRLPESTDSPNLVRFDGVATMVNSLMNTFLNAGAPDEPGLCRHAETDWMGHCLRRGFRHIIKSAHKAGTIDDVEFENMKAYASFFQFQDGKFVVIAPKQHFLFVTKFFAKLQKKMSKRVPLPDLADYEINKNFFRIRRLKKSLKGDSDPEVTQVLRKNYRRKLQRTGRTSPEDYVLSTYSKFQINELASLMTETITMMTSESGKVVLVRKDYSSLFAKIDDLDAKITDLAVAAGTESDQAKLDKIDQDITAAKAQIVDLRNQISSVTLTEQIDAAKKKKDDLVNQEITEKNGDARAVLAGAIQDQDDVISGLQDKLASESVVVNLTPSDIYRFTIHFLDISIEKKKRAKGESYLYGTNPTYGDIVVAAYLTGDLDPLTLKSILSMKELHEAYTSPLLAFGKVMLDISKTILMIYPVTAIPATIAVILIQSIQSKNTYEKQTADKTHLI